MNDILYFLLTFLLGLISGVLFFGGLWFTVKKALGAKTPALWFLLSFIMRTSITLFGFYFASATWQSLLTCLSGFIIARYLIKQFARVNEAHVSLPSLRKEAHETES